MEGLCEPSGSGEDGQRSYRGDGEGRAYVSKYLEIIQPIRGEGPFL